VCPFVPLCLLHGLLYLYARRRAAGLVAFWSARRSGPSGPRPGPRSRPSPASASRLVSRAPARCSPLGLRLRHAHSPLCSLSPRTASPSLPPFFAKAPDCRRPRRRTHQTPHTSGAATFDASAVKCALRLTSAAFGSALPDTPANQ
jgi:hypothetical protein